MGHDCVPQSLEFDNKLPTQKPYPYKKNKRKTRS